MKKTEVILSNACFRIVVSANCGLGECSYDFFKNHTNSVCGENDFGFPLEDPLASSGNILPCLFGLFCPRALFSSRW